MVRSTVDVRVWVVAGMLGLVGCAASDEGGQMDDASSSSTAKPAAPAPSARDDLIPAGEEAPDFAAVDHTGRRRVLSDLLEDSSVVLIFYPKDFTSVCTKQLCAVRDDWSEFRRRDAIVLGVNPAGVDEHARFAAEHEFPFPVLVDEGSVICAAYGAKGSNPDIPQRTVYVIRRDGRVALGERGVVPHEKIFAALDRR